MYVPMWNFSNWDTNGAEESVVVSEVSSFQRLKCMQEWYLGWEKVSCLERCPQFRSVLRKHAAFFPTLAKKQTYSEVSVNFALM